MARRRISAIPARAVAHGSVSEWSSEPRASTRDAVINRFLLERYFFKLGFTIEELQLLIGDPEDCKHLDYDKVVQTGHFFKSYGVRKKRLRELYLEFPELVDCDVSKTMQPVVDTLRNSMPFKLLQDDLSRMVSANPTFLLLSPDHIIKVSTYLHKLEVNCVKVFRRNPEILSKSIEQDLQPLVDYLQDLAKGKLGVGVLLSEEPAIGVASVEGHLKPAVNFLQENGVDKALIPTCLARGPFLFTRSVEKHLKPKLEYLLELGLSREQVVKLVVRYPLTFKNDLVGKVEALMTFFGQRGAGKADVLSMIARFPSLVNYAEETIAQKVDYVLHEGRTIESVIDFPQVAGCSLRDRIVPRLEALRKWGIEGLSLSSILACKEEDFNNRLKSYWIDKYGSHVPDVGDSHWEWVLTRISKSE